MKILTQDKQRLNYLLEEKDRNNAQLKLELKDIKEKVQRNFCKKGEFIKRTQRNQLHENIVFWSFSCIFKKSM